MKIILGVSGSISAYKVPALLRLLQKENISVTPILTQNATQFVTKLTLSTLSENKVYDEADNFNPNIPHLSLLKDCDCFVVAPATANVIAKLASGICNDILSASFLSYTGPKLIVPSMHHEMYINPITQDNIKKLKSLGVHVLGPDNGPLACGDVGMGRFVECDLIVQKVKAMSFKPLSLSKKRILITSGGTKESIDNVRFISNASSGKLGESIAHMASFYDAEVQLISTVKPLQNTAITHEAVSSVNEMQMALNQAIKDVDVLIMAAAVSDFTVPKSSGKLKRKDQLNLALESTPDLIKGALKIARPEMVIGFCLEDDNLDDVARSKLSDKGLDVIIGNSSKVIGQDSRDVVFYKKGKENPICFNEASLETISYEVLRCI